MRKLMFLYPSSLQKRGNPLSTFRVSQQQRWRSCWILSTQRQFWSQWKTSKSFFPQRVCSSLKVSLGVPAGPAWILKRGLQPIHRVVTVRQNYVIKLEIMLAQCIKRACSMKHALFSNHRFALLYLNAVHLLFGYCLVQHRSCCPKPYTTVMHIAEVTMFFFF